MCENFQHHEVRITFHEKSVKYFKCTFWEDGSPLLFKNKGLPKVGYEICSGVFDLQSLKRECNVYRTRTLPSTAVYQQQRHGGYCPTFLNIDFWLLGPVPISESRTRVFVHSTGYPQTRWDAKNPSNNLSFKVFKMHFLIPQWTTILLWEANSRATGLKIAPSYSRRTI
jgi:hypothetical protein